MPVNLDCCLFGNDTPNSAWPFPAGLAENLVGRTAVVPTLAGKRYLTTVWAFSLSQDYFGRSLTANWAGAGFVGG